jgi:outer membrane protein OmpA-like peptidoglycan-associated protein
MNIQTIIKRADSGFSAWLLGAAFVGIAGAFVVTVSGCTSNRPVEGPDKMFVGEAVGALQGAGAGAVTGAQLSAGAGPGAAVGAGLGAVVGAIHGAVADANEEVAMRTEKEIQEQQARAAAQEILAEHFKRRLALHPSRDIFPADLFFDGDDVKVCKSGLAVIKELALMNEKRLPYSSLVVAVYSKGASSESQYSQHLTEERAKNFANQLIHAGMEPRRIQTRAVVVDAPVVIDPLDNPARYNQAIEIIAIDR